MLGGKSAYAPAFYTTTIFLASIAVGLAAGLITGCIGAGGGFIITPALMAAGVKGILAVGTDLFHIFAKAIMGKGVCPQGTAVRLRFQEELDWSARRSRLRWVNVKSGSPRLRQCLQLYSKHFFTKAPSEEKNHA